MKVWCFMMTKEDFYGYLRAFEIYEGDIVLTVEYNENGVSYFGTFSQDKVLGFEYNLYEISEDGNSVILCDGTHQRWQTSNWPNASYEEYRDYADQF